VKRPGSDFAARVVEWQNRAGRQDLPWQGTRDPYRIWLSEVMLQQTQVATVVPYYGRFLERFPDVLALASASLDEVLRLWSGLGYYSRGRNLHRAAAHIVEVHEGRFPTRVGELVLLPGVGRSTAAAIAVFSVGAREAILDGNVKRVLARCFAVEGFPGDAPVQKRLWGLAESLLPHDGIEQYTQGLMDLGATVCTRSSPACTRCPVASTCKARGLGRTGELPTPRPRRSLPKRRTVMMLVFRGGKVLLQKRPPTGIWGGLWSLPEFSSVRHALEVFPGTQGVTLQSHRALEPLKHGFTHYSLTIEPLLCTARGTPRQVNESGGVWLALDEAIKSPIPAPVRTLLKQAAALGPF
jgi:A/G-specific adenine glycosylase